MLKPLIRSVDRTRFEGPLALLLGASSAFAVFAMPTDLFGSLPGAEALPFARPAMAGVTALALTAIGYVAMRRPAHRPADAWADRDLFDEEEEEEHSVRMRRADRHPDAPARQPIRASRDLGEPFMDVGVAPPARSAKPDYDEDEAGGDVDPANLWSLDRPAYAPEDDVSDIALSPDDAEPYDVAPEVAAPEPVAPGPVVSDLEFVDPVVEPVDETPAPIAAFEPEAEPAPAPVRSQRQSLSAMMERLSAGVDRRGGTPPARLSRESLADAYGQPRAAAPDLRDALDELNRLAGRR